MTNNPRNLGCGDCSFGSRQWDHRQASRIRRAMAPSTFCASPNRSPAAVKRRSISAMVSSEGESACAAGCDHCPIHPIRKVEWRSSGPTDYCADLSVALHYYNAQDKWNDDHSLLGLGFEKMLAAPTQEAAARWPRQCSAIRTCLDRLARYEAEGSEDLDAVSGCFGELMAELFDYRQDHWSPELRSIGFNLGKYIYLLDAYDDLARDERKGAYNPLHALSREPGYEEEMREIFELLLANCARSFERLPCVEDVDLLRNILYSGVWLKYHCKNAKKKDKTA